MLISIDASIMKSYSNMQHQTSVATVTLLVANVQSWFMQNQQIYQVSIFLIPASATHALLCDESAISNVPYCTPKEMCGLLTLVELTFLLKF